MKNMQDFHKWLSSVNETPTSHKRRFVGLTHLDRARLMKATGEVTWFYWEASQPTSAS